MSTRHFFTAGTTGAPPQAGRPFLSSQAWRAGSSLYSPCSVPTHPTPAESGARARTRAGAGNSVQLRPPSHDVLGRRCTGRIGDLGPGGPTVPGQFDPVGRADVHRVAARRDAVGGDVLPLGAELLDLPVGPRLAAVGR